MLNERCYVRSLALVNVSFDSESIAVFCEYLSKKPYVEDLDLSDNRLDPKLFLAHLASSEQTIILEAAEHKLELTA